MSKITVGKLLQTALTGRRPVKDAVFAFHRKAEKNNYGITHYDYWVSPSRPVETCVICIVHYKSGKKKQYSHSIDIWPSPMNEALREALDHGHRLEEGKRMAKALERKR